MDLHNRIKNELTKLDQIMEMVAGEELNESELLDLIEGETEINDCIFLLDELIVEKESHIAAIKSRMETLKIRLDRIESSRESLRNIILAAMDKAGLKSLVTPTTTITVKRTPAKVIIEDESKLPTKYYVPQDPKLDKKLLADDLKGGEQIEGAVMSNGGITLQVKRT